MNTQKSFECCYIFCFFALVTSYSLLSPPPPFFPSLSPSLPSLLPILSYPLSPRKLSSHQLFITHFPLPSSLHLYSSSSGLNFLFPLLKFSNCCFTAAAVFFNKRFSDRRCLMAMR